MGGGDAQQGREITTATRGTPVAQSDQVHLAEEVLLSTKSFQRIARQGALRVLVLVQLESASAAEAVEGELAHLASEAAAERAIATHCLAEAGILAALRWRAGDDEARAEVARNAIAILMALA